MSHLYSQTWSYIASLGVVLLLLPAQLMAQDSSLPQWVNNPSKQFSDAQYLMAVGSSTSRQGAKNQAQANLAKRFVAEVEVDENYVQEFKEQVNEQGETTTQENTQLITQSDVGSDQQMKNVEIKEVHEAADGTFYALAAMDRLETSRLYTEEINRNNKAISSLRKKAKQTSSKLERLIFMKQAMVSARMNKMLTNQRAILSGQSGQFENQSLPEITQEYRQAKQECTVLISSKEVDPKIISAISRVLQNEGFTVVDASTTPVVEVKVGLMIEPVDLNRPNVEFMQWALQVEAQNKENGRWFSTYMAEGREGSMNKQYARKRVLQAVQRTLNSEFSAFINEELLAVN
ncbi:LPP20 lipoprotein [Fodinibius salinus]|uniref:LPP20 lipoprotein n=1 Tax=Fodinibius salinus TaxID=860790 RepID=A0A5D3YJ74_9BACT|nr:LPP20 family lipoprotein [Fodinibius salinus]TYP93500.1 LPP20 lipoprotein [Fodinibius salinus]